MSGVTGNQKIQSRDDFIKILKKATELIKGFPGFVSVSPTGSYNSDPKKTTFGDIDLITHIDGSLYGNDKTSLKKKLAEYMNSQLKTVVVPFMSDRYKGKRYYNSGEIITISLKVQDRNIAAAQVDYMIAMDPSEAKFKQDFLDMPAAKQGLVLGLVKTALIEQKPDDVFKKMKIRETAKNLTDVQEFEYNLSSKEIQLRKVTYDRPGSYKQVKREIVWTSRNWNILQLILINFDLQLPFEGLLKQAKLKLKNPRSSKRMAGVFKSMISIKSGEVGKQKGVDKQKALDKVRKIFGESVLLSFKDFSQ